jgi:DNA-binding PadR family transcriptional regulator
MMTKTAKRDPRSLLPLTQPVFHILLALADGERHGYAIIQEIERRTGGSLTLRTGTLYTALARMLRLGLIDETDERPDPESDDERRRYYRISTFGREVAKGEASRMRALVALASDKKVIAR